MQGLTLVDFRSVLRVEARFFAEWLVVVLLPHAERECLGNAGVWVV